MISSIDSIAERTRSLTASGKVVVFANGCFDILHPGHVDLLRRARALGDYLVVAINSDASVKRLKGSARPIFNQEERAEILGALSSVDAVCVFHEDTPLETILRIRPGVIVKGGDWAPDQIVGRREVESWGGRAVSIPLVDGHSTTGIVERILARSTGRAG